MKKIELDEPESRSADLVTGNLEALRGLFPEAFTEGKVDFDVLRQLLGGSVDGREERFGLNWRGKRQARQLALTPSTGTLRPCPEQSVAWETTQNLFIEGDNLEVLKLLTKSYQARVKLIYIDPPYNTGKDRVYPDDFQNSIRNYLELTEQIDGGRKLTTHTEASGRYHTDWLNMMFPRLKLARNLLRDDGVIAVSIDHHELANLRNMLIEIFGIENDVNTFTWVNNLKGRQISSHGAALTHEFIVVWAKNLDLVGEFTVPVEWARSRLPSAYKGFDYEVLRDAKGEYVLKNQLYNTNSAFNEVSRPNLVFNIHYNSVTEEVRTTDVDDPQSFDGFELVRPHRCNDGRHKYHAWRWSRPKVVGEVDDLAFLPSTEGLRIFTKVRGHATTVLKDLITDISTTEGAKCVESLLGSSPFSYPKPLSLVQLLVQAVASADEEAVLVDFFAGSGTTGHAVLAQNAADGGNRRYLCVQLPEPLDPENKDQKVAADCCDELGRPRTIAELTKERLRRAGQKVREENRLFAGDTGFRVYRLDSTNLKPWDPQPADVGNALLAAVDHIKPGRSEADLLTEILLKLGLELTVPIETRVISHKTAYNVGLGALIACLAPRIERSDAEPLALGIVTWLRETRPAVADNGKKAARETTTVLFRDSAFADDVAKANMSAILSQHGLDNVRSL